MKPSLVVGALSTLFTTLVLSVPAPHSFEVTLAFDASSNKAPQAFEEPLTAFAVFYPEKLGAFPFNRTIPIDGKSHDIGMNIYVVEA